MRREDSISNPLTGGIFALLPLDRFSASELAQRAQRAVPGGRLRIPGKSSERHLSYLAGRAALAAIFESRGLPAWVTADSEFGYLKVVSQTAHPIGDIYANVSHTKGIAVAVVMPHPVGIDIEATSRSAARVMERMSSDRERTGLPVSVALPGGDVPSGILLWSAKEAVSKATGLGIKFGLHHFIVDVRGPRPFPVDLQITGPLGVTDPAVLAFRRDNWVITICSSRSVLNRDLREISI
jgi:hypothetical protein